MSWEGFPVTRRGVLFAVVLVAGLLAGCSAGQEKAIEVPVTVEVTVPVVQTQVVVETREVEKTVVVTATPVPTPAYVSKSNAPAGTLVYPLSGEPITLDPQEAVDEASGMLVQQLYEGLFKMRGDGTIVPGAATGFQVSKDGTVYTVTLRTGMLWSDGRPVIAQHYVDGVCRLLEPALGNSYYSLLTDVAQIKGARDYASGDVADCKTVGVKAVDNRTLQITLAQPVGFLPKLLAFRTFLPARLDLTGGIAGAAPPITATVGLVSNGPYLLKEHVPNDHITLTKNPAYWDAAAVGIDRIVFKVVPALADQLAAYEKGDLQVAEFPGEETPRIQADPGLAKELQVLVRPGTSYLGLNTQVGPTADVNFRRAVASAIDRRALIEDVLKQPWHVPAQVLVPPGMPGYQGNDPTVGYAYDPNAVTRYLKEAGYDEGHPPPPVELWYNREGNNEALFKAIGAMLEKAGIPVRLMSSDWNVYLQSLDDCNKPNQAAATKKPGDCTYNLYRMGWVMDYADPSGILDVVFNPSSSFQYTGWSSEAYVKLLSEARAQPDDARRATLYKQAEKLLLNDVVAAVPLQHYDRTVLVKVAQFDYPPFGAPNFQYWKLP